ncbi:mitochondrial substrate carrier family protein [Citrus sinensis]|nr:mitochondrial substrate carrier family protein [Citrus sinensis]
MNMGLNPILKESTSTINDNGRVQFPGSDVRLDKTKFYIVGAGLFTGVTVALYPVSVVKTRLQVATKDTAERNAFSVIRGILRTDGIPGLYRGFGTVITGAIPARILFLTALETTKAAAFKIVEPFKLSEPAQAAIANGIAGMTASMCAQAVFVPIDVVSQKLMVQGYSGHAKYSGGLDVARKVIQSDGLRGLYRGFGLSVMTYSPSSAVWWASYGSSQRVIWRFLGHGTGIDDAVPSQSKIVLVQATGGLIAGATASCITTPLDTIKTRLQVMGHDRRPSATQVVKKLISEDGWKGLYRGLGPRFFSMSAWGTSMILAYEYLTIISVVMELDPDGGGSWSWILNLSPSYFLLSHIHLWLVLSNLADPWIYLALRLTKNVARNSTESIVKLTCHHLQINVEDVGGFYTSVNRRCARYISSPVVSENKSEIQDGI